MNFQSLILVIIFPFIGALLNGLMIFWKPRLSRVIVFGSLIATLIACLICLNLILTEGTITYKLGGWQAPYGIEFIADSFNITLCLIVLIVAFLNLIHSGQITKYLYPRGPQFYTLYLLLVVSFLGIILTADVFNLYVFLEISALTTYALIGRGDGRACRAALSYLILGTIGASLYLIGVGYLYIKTGTLSFTDLQNLLPQLYDSVTVQIGFSMIVVGLMIKMAAFPLHSWMPNAYAYCPQPSAGLLAPVATKVSIFILFKIIFCVFGYDFIKDSMIFPSILVNLAAIGIMFSCLMAIAHKNLLKSLLYILLAEICYIFGGLWLANRMGLTGSAYHLISDILIAFALFLIIGSVRTHKQAFDHKNIKHFFQEMPFTAAAFVVVALTIIGVPPTCGFVSKMYLLSGAYQANQWLFFISLIFASISTAIVFISILEKSYFSKDRVEAYKVRDKSWYQTIPLYIVVISLILIGVFQSKLVDFIISPVIF